MLIKAAPLLLVLALAPAQRETPVRARDDYYAHVNAAWVRATPIPAAVPWISPFVENTLRVQARTRKLVQAAAASEAADGTDARRLGDLYRSYMDEARIEAAGVTPLAPAFAELDAMRTPTELAATLAAFGRQHASVDPDDRLPDVTPIAIAVEADPSDSTRTTLVLDAAGLGLPGRSYYLDASSQGVALRDAYRSHVAAMLASSGETDSRAADRVLALETQFAQAMLTGEQLHDPSLADAHVSVASLERLYPGLPWHSFLQDADLARVEVVTVREPTQVRAVAAAAASVPVATWRSYLRWQLIRRYAPYLSRPYREAAFRFYDARLQGVAVARPRAELGALLVEGAMPEPVGRLYVRRYFDPAAKQDVTAMAEAIRATFATRIRAADWLEPATRAAALDKLGKLLIKVGYPNHWESHVDLAIRADDLVGNLQRLSERAYRSRLARLDAPVDRQRWLTAPQATNAYYNRSTNELAIPAGYLQPPWYDRHATLAANYGGIGTVIGHEMGHAFDDQGARYDGEGRLRNWWTARDSERFAARIVGLVRQYDGYEPLPGVRVSGRLTISENVGDLTGVTLAHAALARATPGGGQSRDRAFFRSFCVHWRARYRDPLLRRIVAGDGHPPQPYRCNGPLSNFAPFYSAYAVRAGDGMWRAPADRVVLW